MADLGRIKRDKLPPKKGDPGAAPRYRYRIDLGRLPDGSRAIVSRWYGARLVSREAAEEALEQFRSTVAVRRIEWRQLYAEVTGRGAEEMMYRYWRDRYLEHWRGLVSSGKRSPGTIREIERYAAPEGHWSYWEGRPIRGLEYGHIEDWHALLAERGIGLKTQKNVSDGFRTFLRWCELRDSQISVPRFPGIDPPRHVPHVISVDEQLAILDAIPWEIRGAFLAAATEALRAGEIAALKLKDYRDGRLRVASALQGRGKGARIANRTKNNAGQWRDLWSVDLRAWCEERIASAGPEAALRGEALFWNPRARLKTKRPTHDWLEKRWAEACEKAGVDPAPNFQEGTRHAILTALGHALPERQLRAFSRHADARSLDRYSQPKPESGAIVAALDKRKR